jgi:hypothetical protein
MPSGGDQSPAPPPPPPVASASDEEEEDDAEAEDVAQSAGSPTPQIQQRFDELCSRLNMDEAARAEAWDSYRSMSESYTLEVRSGGDRAGGFVGLVCAARPSRERGSLCRPCVRDTRLGEGLGGSAGESCRAAFPSWVQGGGHLSLYKSGCAWPM